MKLSGRALHFAFKVGDKACTIKFFKDVLGMKILRHEEFIKSCDAGPYDNRWSKTMVGYGSEDTHFVVELTYNYNVNNYNLGNDFLGLTIKSSEAIANAKKHNWPIEEKDGCIIVKAPGGYSFHLLNEPQPSDTDPVQKVTLASSNLQKSIDYWNGILGLKLFNQGDRCAVIGFEENQAKLELVDIGSEVKHETAYGRITFSVPFKQLKDIDQKIKGTNQTILTQLTTLDTTGKATVTVIILADPDAHEICFVDDEGFRKLSKVDPDSDAALDAEIDSNFGQKYSETFTVYEHTRGATLKSNANCNQTKNGVASIGPVDVNITRDKAAVLKRSFSSDKPKGKKFRKRQKKHTVGTEDTVLKNAEGELIEDSHSLKNQDSRTDIVDYIRPAALKRKTSDNQSENDILSIGPVDLNNTPDKENGEQYDDDNELMSQSLGVNNGTEPTQAATLKSSGSGDTSNEAHVLMDLNKTVERDYEVVDHPSDRYFPLLVGSTKFTLLKSTIYKEPNSLLAKLVNGDDLGEISIEKENGIYCFDDLPQFHTALSFLSTGRITKNENIDLHDVLNVAEYFNFERMAIELKKIIDKNKVNKNDDRCLFPFENKNEIFSKDEDDSDVRRRCYITWSNDPNVQHLFKNTLAHAKSFFAKYYLEVEDAEMKKDILNVLYDEKGKRYNERNKTKAERIRVNFKLKDYPLSFAIPISKFILAQLGRSFATSKVHKIGYQHVFVSNYVEDSSNASSTNNSTTDTEGFSSPTIDSDLDSSLKTCQLAKKVDFNELLAAHDDNSTRISPTKDGVHVDILILIKDKEECKILSKYLGIIWLDQVVAEAKIRAPKQTVSQVRARNKNVKLYTLIQNHLSRKLMFGRSNIVLTSIQSYFIHLKAHVKATILTKGKVAEFNLHDYINMEITLSEKPNTLEYIQSINQIINTVLNVRNDIDAVYYSKQDQKFYIIQFPLFSVIPLYILNFVAHLLHRNPNNCINFSFESL